MPTINFSYKDFQQLLGKKLPINEFKDLALLYAKAEVDSVENDEVKLSLDDTNLPYLWSVEGLARYFKGILNLERGIPKLKIEKSTYDIIVDDSVKKFRPYIATFVAKGESISEYLLKQIIQLQEKYCEGYGRKRQKVSIGLYSSSNIKFPVHYKSVAPESIKFIPLEMSKPMTLGQTLTQCPKGKEYGWIIKNQPEYPILIDSNDEVLSLVPIINSNFTGKLKVGDCELLFEATGSDEEAVNMAANIFAQNLFERGFTIVATTIHDKTKYSSPVNTEESIVVDPKHITSLTGLTLTQKETKNLLERARYNVTQGRVIIPSFRKDILHVNDIIEDIAIMYGFDKIESMPLTSYTVGSPEVLGQFADKTRELALGLGFQEVLSPILSNVNFLATKMSANPKGIVQIQNIMSETYSAIRNWLVPVLMEVFSKNKHNDYPQLIFEEGIINKLQSDTIIESRSMAFGISHTSADFTQIKQILDVIMKSFGLDYELENLLHPSFINGRSATIICKRTKLGIIGEINPQVLVNWQLDMPVCVLELDVSKLSSISNS